MFSPKTKKFAIIKIKPTVPISDCKLEIEVGYIYSKKYKLSRIDRIFMDLMVETIHELAQTKPEQLLRK